MKMVRFVQVSITAIGLVATHLTVLTPLHAAGPNLDSWASVADLRLGFKIAYPSDVFEAKAVPQGSEGQVFVSRDGKAKLLIGAFANTDAYSMAEYRDFLIKETYSGADIDYAPVRNTWFVLSGNRNGETFYQRVSFTCGGGLISSWAMLYPQVEKGFYDRIVERVAPTYAPGTSRTGNCSLPATETQAE